MSINYENLFFEGQALDTTLAHPSISKQKRNDCQLVSLDLAVDSRGFPLFTRVYPGNVGEPASLEEDIFTVKGILRFVIRYSASSAPGRALRRFFKEI